jgi:predicted nucleic acid-binding protein
VILADTSVWIDHFRTGNADMQRELSQDRIMTHPFVVAELALGSIKERSRTLALLDLLPQVRLAQLGEVRSLIEARQLYNLGLGLIDAALIASVLLTPPVLLWTKDRRLRKTAESLGIHAQLI